jgi:mRNA-degrading endonuclease toxin of MazEF toxin-antitoxin module
MVDKAYTVARDRIGKRIGNVTPETLLAVNGALAMFLGFA